METIKNINSSDSVSEPFSCGRLLQSGLSYGCRVAVRNRAGIEAVLFSPSIVVDTTAPHVSPDSEICGSYVRSVFSKITWKKRCIILYMRNVRSYYIKHFKNIIRTIYFTVSNILWLYFVESLLSGSKQSLQFGSEVHQFRKTWFSGIIKILIRKRPSCCRLSSRCLCPLETPSCMMVTSGL